jgi:nitrogenase molybdenum-iron protein NifN
VPTTLGGTPPDAIARMGQSVMTFAVGQHMRGPAEALRRRTNVPFRVFDTVMGLEPFDAFIAELMAVSGRSAPAAIRRQRSRLVDAMLDGHACFAGRRVALAAEPDLLVSLASFLSGLGCDIVRAVSPCNAPSLAQVPADAVVVGDFDEIEQAAMGADRTPELIVANAHAEAISRLSGVPLFRAGFPIFDRLGAAQRVNVGYDGARALLFELANLFLEHDGAGVRGGSGCRTPFDNKDMCIDATTSSR